MRRRESGVRVPLAADVPCAWRLLLKASADPKLIPLESFSARIATRLWGDGPWLLRRRRPADSGNAPVGRAARSISFGPHRRAAGRSKRDVRLGKSRGTLYAARAARIPRPAASSGRAIVRGEAVADIGQIRIQLDDTKRRLLVKRLGVPMSSH